MILYVIRCQSPCIFVLGDAGTKYSWPVEHESNYKSIGLAR